MRKKPETLTPETFWEGASLDDAGFKLKIASEQLDIETAKIYDRLQDENLKFYRHWEAAQVEDARQALGFQPTRPSRQALELAILETASKLGWVSAQCTASDEVTTPSKPRSNLGHSPQT